MRMRLYSIRSRSNANRHSNTDHDGRTTIRFCIVCLLKCVTHASHVGHDVPEVPAAVQRRGGVPGLLGGGVLAERAGLPEVRRRRPGGTHQDTPLPVALPRMPPVAVLGERRNAHAPEQNSADQVILGDPAHDHVVKMRQQNGHEVARLRTQALPMAPRELSDSVVHGPLCPGDNGRLGSRPFARCRGDGRTRRRRPWPPDASR